MQHLPETLRCLITPSLDAVWELYASMDEAYAQRASSLGFSCSGCSDSCCEERFYHYTLIEFLYLREGIYSLDPETRETVFRRAGDVAAIYWTDDATGRSRRVLCPLNNEGLCMLYAFRPMVCRLHGIPHVLRKPGRDEQAGTGCDPFERKFSGTKIQDFVLDRTPFYTSLAAIEIGVRQALGFQNRLKKTIADMILDCQGPAAF